MPRERLSVRKIREALRQKFGCGLSNRQIARSCGVARSTVAEYFWRFGTSGLSWPLPDGMDDVVLTDRLFPPQSLLPTPMMRPLPDWSYIRGELRKKGVTLTLVWEEYRAQFPDGYAYSRFCDRYREWLCKRDLVLRQEYKSGEKLFVDYAGKTVDIADADTGEIREAQIFVAVLGASSYTYAEATWTQSLPDWIGSHVRAFEYIGGSTVELIPDNLKSAVTRPCYYEPEINPTYEKMAAHYGAVVLPARVRKPRDKAKVEAGVLLVTRWILARLRKRTFFSLFELNEAIRPLLEALNNRPFRKLPGSRRSLFETQERAMLLSLPEHRYEYADWSFARVNLDYHVLVDWHNYSVPYVLRGEKLDIRLTATTVECFHRGRRVASHVRSHIRYGYTTVKEHMPTSHQEYLEWPPSRLVRWAATIGPNTEIVVDRILAEKAHPVQGYKRCFGILGLSKKFGRDRLEAASTRALAINSLNYQSIHSILKTSSDKRPLRKQPVQEVLPLEHENIRGSKYFH